MGDLYDTSTRVKHVVALCAAPGSWSWCVSRLIFTALHLIISAKCTIIYTLKYFSTGVTSVRAIILNIQLLTGVCLCRSDSCCITFEHSWFITHMVFFLKKNSLKELHAYLWNLILLIWFTMH